MRTILVYFYALTCVFLINISYGEMLQKVTINGNDNTKKLYIMKHGNFKVGDNISPKKLIEIKERLKRINQISIKNVVLKNGTLYIDIKDKWTLFPIPMITQSGNYFSRGILLYDNNFLGTLSTFAPAIAWTNSGINGLLYFQDETFFSPTTGFKILILKKDDLSEFERQGEITTSFESKNNIILFAPNILYKKQVFKAGPFYYNKKLTSNKSAINKIDYGKGFFFRHHYNDYEKLKISFNGLVTTFNLFAYKSKNSKFIYLSEADIKWNKQIFQDDFLNIKFHSGYINSANIIHAKVAGGSEGFRGYDKLSLPLKQYIGGLIQYQKKIIENSFLTPFYEINSIKLSNDIHFNNRFKESTFGLSYYYYFKKISIPAIMFELSRNINDKSTHFLLNIGVNL